MVLVNGGPLVNEYNNKHSHQKKLHQDKHKNVHFPYFPRVKVECGLVCLLAEDCLSFQWQPGQCLLGVLQAGAEPGAGHLQSCYADVNGQ